MLNKVCTCHWQIWNQQIYQWIIDLNLSASKMHMLLNSNYCKLEKEFQDRRRLQILLVIGHIIQSDMFIIVGSGHQSLFWALTTKCLLSQTRITQCMTHPPPYLKILRITADHYLLLTIFLTFQSYAWPWYRLQTAVNSAYMVFMTIKHLLRPEG